MNLNAHLLRNVIGIGVRRVNGRIAAVENTVSIAQT